MKIYIISDEILIENQKWICDRLKDQFIKYFPEHSTNNPEEANYIWYIAPWNYQYIPEEYDESKWFSLLSRKKVVATIHHIDTDKFLKGKYNRQFKFINKFATLIHSICPQTTRDIQKLEVFKIPIITRYLWIKDPQFYYINEKDKLKKKYGINKNFFIIGNFQNDKKSKSPELFLKIIIDMVENGKKIEVILCGRNRHFLIENFNKIGIKYHYFNMVSIENINELYNCLDLYIITSRYEGGPRSIIECALTRTPVISTKVGIAPEFMDKNSLFDVDDWETYRNARPNTDILEKNIRFLKNDEYFIKFRRLIFE